MTDIQGRRVLASVGDLVLCVEPNRDPVPTRASLQVGGRWVAGLDVRQLRQLAIVALDAADALEECAQQ